MFVCSFGCSFGSNLSIGAEYTSSCLLRHLLMHAQVFFSNPYLVKPPSYSLWKEEEYEARGKNVAIFTANEHDRIMILTCPRILTAQDYS